MAWQMNYTDPTYGETYPNSYWNIAENNAQTRPGKTGRIVFYGYVDKAHYDDQTHTPRVIGQKDYVIDRETYEAIVQCPLPNPLPDTVTTPEGVIAYQVYTYSKNKKDIPDGNGGTKSFFEEAIPA